jgi:hypothetical protein
MALVAILLVAGPPARAGFLPWSDTPSSVCANPDVLDWVRQHLRARKPYARIDPRTVNEVPGEAADVVRCGVCAQVFVYDPARARLTPVAGCDAHGYRVRARPNGFVVLSLD